MRLSTAAALLQLAVATAAPGFVTYDSLGGQPYTVTYDARSFYLNGTPTIFNSGCIHYPRSTPEMWDDLFAKARNDGLNMVQTYWFWNLHQHRQSDWVFDFNGDLKTYLSKAAEHGLFVNFRIGPYVCAEWNYGGFPVWINKYSNLTTRSSEPTWEALMSTAFNRIIAEVRDYFADRGGPIVLSQVENEYALWAVDGALPSGQCDLEYVQWAGELAMSSGVPIPFEMCNGYSANVTDGPGIINSCNGNDCAAFIEQHGANGKVLVSQPAMWTENEEWFQAWGMPYPDTTPIPGFDPPSRTADNLAFSVARWFARGGSHHNYYMWHGGNHYGRMAGSSVANWYANGANLNADGLANEPYRSHLKTLHWLLVQLAPILLASPAQVWNRTYLQWYDRANGQWQAGTNQSVAFIYSNEAGYAAFLECTRPAPCLLRFPGSSTGQTWYVVNGSMIIIDAAGSVMYNTSDVAPATVQRTYTPLPALSWSSWPDSLLTPSSERSGQDGQALVAQARAASRKLQSGGSTVGSVTTSPTPIEQLALTEDDTEYVMYARVVTTGELRAVWQGLLHGAGGHVGAALASASSVPLFIRSQLAQAFVAWLDYTYAANAYDSRHNFAINSTTKKFDGHSNFTLSLNMTAVLGRMVDGQTGAWRGGSSSAEAEQDVSSSATPQLFILSESLGIDNGHGAWVVEGQPLSKKGLFDAVTLGGVSIVTGGTWTMTVGLGGEAQEVYTAEGGAAVQWTAVDPVNNPPGTPLTWYRTFFTTPSSLVDSLRSPVKTGQALAPWVEARQDEGKQERTKPVPHPTSTAPLPEVTTSLLLDIGPSLPTLGRGHFYLNGFDLGRYWSILGYNTTSPGQRYYMLPPDLLVPDVPGGNVLALVDVLPGTDFSRVQLVTSQLVPV